MNLPSSAVVRQNTLALVTGVVGYLAATWIGFPAASLTGPALLVSTASLAGVRVDIHQWLRNCAFLLIGIAMGTSVSPEVFQAARQWPGSFLLLAVSLLVIFFVCRSVLERLWHLDRQTSTLSSTPGHMSYILGLTLNVKSDIATVSVIQSIRVLALTLIVPVVVTLLGYRAPDASTTLPDMATAQLMTILAGSLVCALIFERINLAAAFLLAGMAASSFAHVTDWADGNLPAYLSLPAFVLMGTIIGTRLSGVSWQMLKRASIAGLATTGVAMILSASAAWAYSSFSGLSLGQLLIAFAPGGVEAMIAMALILDADPTFVAAHHVWRLLVLTVLAPFMLARSRAPGR